MDDLRNAVAMIDAFDADCAAAEHTDTQAAWDLLHALRKILNGRIRPATPLVGGGLTCPGCGEADNLWHAEDILAIRRAIGVSNGGEAFVFEGEYDVLDEGGCDERLLCRACGEEWALPLPAEFV